MLITITKRMTSHLYKKMYPLKYCVYHAPMGVHSSVIDPIDGLKGGVHSSVIDPIDGLKGQRSFSV